MAEPEKSYSREKDMSTYKAKEMFEDALKYTDAATDPAAYDLYAGLYQLTQGLEIEIRRLHDEIAHVSRQVAQLQE